MTDLHIANPTHLSKMLMRNITVLLFVVFLSVNALIGLADNPEHHRVVILDKNAKNNTYINQYTCNTTNSILCMQPIFKSKRKQHTAKTAIIIRIIKCKFNSVYTFKIFPVSYPQGGNRYIKKFNY